MTSRNIANDTVSGDESRPAFPWNGLELLDYVIDDRYKLQEVIGVGGFGAVIRASHTRLPRDLAVKLLLPARASSSDNVARFKQEVQAIARIAHPNVVEVIDFGYDAKAGYFIVMPLLNGEPLSQRLERKPLTIVDIHTVVSQLAAALGAAHLAGIVHRDVKAENVFLQNDPSASTGWSVRLFDFGGAKLEVVGEHAAGAIEDKRVFGTPRSMAPEQITRAPTGPWTDVYALGILLFEALTGQFPFDSETEAKVFRMQVCDAPPRPSSLPNCDWILPSLDSLVMAMLEKDPKRRPDNMAAVLQRWLELQPDALQAWAGRFLGTQQQPRRDGAQWPSGQFANVTRNHADPMPRSVPRLLVVDDDEPMRLLLRAVLQRDGWKCTTCESGAAALAAAHREGPPDGVVIDLMMPDIDGFELLELLRESGFSGPAVFCSAVTSPEVRDRIIETGAGFVMKLTELQAVTHELVRLGARAPASWSAGTR